MLHEATIISSIILLGISTRSFKKHTFPTYFALAKKIFDKAIIDSYAENKFGWRYYFNWQII